jgi:hypothetical protein
MTFRAFPDRFGVRSRSVLLTCDNQQIPNQVDVRSGRALWAGTTSATSTNRVAIPLPRYLLVVGLLSAPKMDSLADHTRRMCLKTILFTTLLVYLGVSLCPLAHPLEPIHLPSELVMRSLAHHRRTCRVQSLMTRKCRYCWFDGRSKY